MSIDSSTPPDGPKPSRYRSVRQQQTSTPPPAPPSVPESNTDTVQRSRSRYHRSRPVENDGASPASQTRTPAAAVVAADKTEHIQNMSPKRSTSSLDGGSSSRYRGRHAQSPDAAPGAQQLRHQASQPTISSLAEEEERRRVLHEKYGRNGRDEHSESRERTRTDSPAAHPQNKPDSRFDQAPQIIHARREGAIGPQDEVISGDESEAGCFSRLFRRKRIDPIKNRPAPAPKAQQSEKSHEPATIKPGGRGIVPGTDAPISAVNAGDRRVLVECNKSSMMLPVTPETTAMDLINSASNVFSETIDVRASLLLEHFGTVGVQRPLRRYERVRDVMNSWDDDRANSFLVVPTRVAEVNPAGLSASSVPQHQPAECSFLMQYSQKPGHWDKRYITLRQDGQIVMTKDAKHKDATNICHMSDFDIYTPTAKQMSKKIKPPKKFCYAIKSQQKASMFLSTSTFVHFFCHADRAQGTSFYDAVQGWRSWYLVNVMGEGQKKAKEVGIRHSPSKRVGNNVNGHKRHSANSSVGSHYQLGSFQPLTVDMSQFDRPSSSHSQKQQLSMGQMPTRKPSVRDRAYPPPSLTKHTLPAKLAEDEPLVHLVSNRRASLEVVDSDDAFATSGLLGRSYSTRRREQQERDDAAKNPFRGGLVNGAGEVGVARQISIKRAGSKRVTNGNGNAQGPARRPSTRDGAPRHGGSIDLGRSGSTRAKPGPKPLIDLTPQYQPPPQHLKKGKGYKPSAEELRTGVLIDAATSGEKSWRDEIPDSKDWRGRANNQAAATEPNQSRVRSRSRSAQQGHGGQHVGGRYASPNGIERPPGSSRGNRNFTGMSNGPLLDVSDASNFKQGSLLNRLEKEHPRPGPIIDRVA